MPNYTYECQGCEYVWDEFHPIVDRSTPMRLPCPRCEKETKIIRLMMEARIARHMVIRGEAKMSEDFKERMRDIKKEHPTMKSRYF